MNDEDTVPPRQPNTPRVLLPRALAWLTSHPNISIPVAAFVVGAILGALVF